MCGIFGIAKTSGNKVSNKDYEDIFKNLFVLSSTRGKEASGYSLILPEIIEVLKSPFAADEFVGLREFNNNLNSSMDKHAGKYVTAIGHSRLATNGSELENRNNQPVIKQGITGIHNGIIVNESELWDKIGRNNKETNLDSEVFFSSIKNNLIDGNLHDSISKTYSQIYGVASVAFVFENYDNLILATNNGSLHYMINDTRDLFIFASEHIILSKLILKCVLRNFDRSRITKLIPNTYLNLNINSLEYSVESFNTNNSKSILVNNNNKRSIRNIEFDRKPKNINKHFATQKQFVPKDEIRSTYIHQRESNFKLKRCTKCILPETFPFIEFDNNGVCNYCNKYSSYKIKGEKELFGITDQYKLSNSGQNIIVGLSGGRDSCYALHYAKKILGLNPIAYSYDWGMLTDLARRNQSRMCAKLGVEHILISANIRKKRGNIRKNVEAWLKSPNLGLVPLFMAGDKQYFYYAQKLMSEYQIDLILFGENLLETTLFKYSFCGIKPNLGYKEKSFSISSSNKIKMMLFYFKEYIKNPSYINTSLLDSLTAFGSYYYISHTYLNLFHYIKWNEDEIIKTLKEEYDWETDPGTKSTWRIGDGTAAFYNYIYYTVAGFSEFDTFRSNQIREGDISREEALKFSIEENQPRWDSLKWYCDTIGINFEESIKIINQIKSKY
jgi:glucosamine--fructose-6-phosphate aminotransferase (isomerizing)